MRIKPFRLALGATLSGSCVGAWAVPLLFLKDPAFFSLGLTLVLGCSGFCIWCLLELRKYH